MKKQLLALGLSLGLTFLLASHTVMAKDHVLFPAEAKELQKFIDQAQAGDRVVLNNGTYHFKQTLRIHNKKNFTLEGQGDVWIILDSIWEDVISVKNSKDLVIRQIRAKHKEPLEDFSCEGAVIHIEKSSQVLIEQCELNGSGAVGVRMEYGNDLIIRDCYLHSNTLAAVMLDKVQYAILHENRIMNNASGIYALSSDVRMNGNLFENNKGKATFSSPFSRKVLGE